MVEITKNGHIKRRCSPLDLFRAMQSEKIEYVYIGEFTSEITDSILSLAELNLETSNDSIKLKKRVYFILVEGLQNITRHQQYDPKYAEYSGLLVIQRFDDTFIITTANYIHNSEKEKLKQHIDKINKLEGEELKQYYRKVLAQQHMSPKGGAGLGLIEIARKSGNKLLYSFERVNDEYSFFYLQTKISLPGSQSKIDFSPKSIEKIKVLHQYLISCRIVFSLAGIFIQEKLVQLLSLLEKRTKEINLRSKLFNIIVELLQNIVKHADDYVLDNIAGHYAIFYIAEDSTYFYVTTGNYIRKEKIEALRKHIDYINSLSIKELANLHYRILQNYKESEDKKIHIGLGLIDIRLKTKEPIECHFENIDDEFSFVTIQVKLKKKQVKLQNLEIKPTKSTPYIYLSSKESKFVIEGPSYPIDAYEFYKPVFEWLKKYAENPRNFTIFNIKLRHINTPSEKALISLFKILEEINKNSVVIIKWFFDEEDESAFAFGNTLKKLFPDLNIQLIKSS